VNIPGAPGFFDMRGAANATVVGGTLFSASPNAPYGESEIAWSSAATLPNWPFLWANLATGGGIATAVPIPSYQTGFGTTNGASTAYRNLPDVAAAAGELLMYFNGTPGAALGTSAAAPLWAGFTALVNQQRKNLGLKPGIGFLNPTLYSLANSNYTANFHDVTSGSNGVTPGANGSGSCAGFNAGTGYDLVTGLGSPTGQLIYNLAASASPSPPTNLKIRGR
jgi:subtilase family serine protease